MTIESEATSVTGLKRIPVPPEAARFAAGEPLWDATLDLVAVVARDASSRSVGLVSGLGLREGAFASSFAHDSHNLLVVGRDAASMAAAANEVRRIGGGLVAAAARQRSPPRSGSRCWGSSPTSRPPGSPTSSKRSKRSSRALA